MANTATIKVLVDDKSLDLLSQKAAQTGKILRGGFDIAIGGAALFGDASAKAMEELANKSIVVANSIDGIGDLLESLSKSDAFLNIAKSAGIGKEAMEGFASKLPLIGIAAVAAIGLGKAFTAIDESVSGTNEALEKQEATLKALEVVGKTVSDYYSNIANSLKAAGIEGLPILRAAEESARVQLEIARVSAGFKIADITPANLKGKELTDFLTFRDTLLGVLDGTIQLSRIDIGPFTENLKKVTEGIMARGSKEVGEKQVKTLTDLVDQVFKLGGAYEQAQVAIGAFTRKRATEREEEKKETEKVGEKGKKVKDTIDKIKKDALAELKSLREGNFREEYLQFIKDVEGYVKDGAFIPTPEMIGEQGGKGIQAGTEFQNKLAKENLKRREKEAKARLEAEAKALRSLGEKTQDWFEKNDELVNQGLATAGQLVDAYQAISDRRLAQIEKEKEARLEALNAEKDLALGIYSESEKDRAIIEEKYRQQKLAEEEKFATEEKKIRKRQADLELAITIAQTVANVAKASADAASKPLLLGLVIAAGAASIAAAIAQRNEVAKLAKGGILSGPSHSAGGIYMGGGVEAEGGEAVINRRSTMAFGGMLSAINQAGGGAPLLSNTGVGTSSATQANPVIDYNLLAAAIASNPVKAFVVTQDITLAQQKQTAIKSKATIA